MRIKPIVGATSKALPQNYSLPITNRKKASSLPTKKSIALLNPVKSQNWVKPTRKKQRQSGKVQDSVLKNGIFKYQSQLEFIKSFDTRSKR